MEAIILAGGFGTRLRSMVSDAPKPMAPVSGRPFLEYLLGYLKRERVSRVVLAVGYKKESIINYFGNQFLGMTLLYSCEDQPLYTGGAIKKALGYCECREVFVVNGDTYFDVPLGKMREAFRAHRADIGVAVKEMNPSSRYGRVLMNTGGHIVGFSSAGPLKRGTVNGGVYLLRRTVLEHLPDAFSFETDVLEKQSAALRLFAFPCDGYFIDIGVPEDYIQAQADFRQMAQGGMP